MAFHQVGSGPESRTRRKNSQTMAPRRPSSIPKTRSRNGHDSFLYSADVNVPKGLGLQQKKRTKAGPVMDGDDRCCSGGFGTAADSSPYPPSYSRECVIGRARAPSHPA